MGDNKPIYILDASVIVKWIFKGEKYQQEALSARQDIERERIEAMVPIHCFTEVINVVALQSKNLAVLFLEELQRSFIRECRLTIESTTRAIELMKKYPKIAFYDAVYHALAFEQKGVLITADEKYYNTASGEGKILNLKDYFQAKS